MSIPASVGLYVNWDNGTVSGGNYTSATPDVPDAFVVAVNNSNVEVASGSPWNGQTLLDVSNNASDGAGFSSLTSAEITATQGRLLFEMEPVTATENGQHLLRATATTTGNFDLLVRRIAGSPDQLEMSVSWNGYASYGIATVDYPANPHAIEVLWDTNNATPGLRFRARVWDIGASPGALQNASSTGGSAGTTDQPVTLNVAEQGGDLIPTRLGRIIVSDDIAEDLSLVSEDSAVALMGAMCL